MRLKSRVLIEFIRKYASALIFGFFVFAVQVQTAKIKHDETRKNLII